MKKFEGYSVGEAIRAYDFPCNFDNYIEGEIIGVLRAGEENVAFDCYHVIASKRYVEGLDEERFHGNEYFVPMGCALLEFDNRVIRLKDVELFAKMGDKGGDFNYWVDAIAKRLSKCSKGVYSSPLL